jgi:hypothetical protein
MKELSNPMEVYIYLQGRRVGQTFTLIGIRNHAADDETTATADIDRRQIWCGIAL